MGARNYAYQYETSPRKIKPEYDTPKRKNNSNKNIASKTAKPKIKSKKIQNKIKAKEAKLARINFSIVMVVSLICILFMMYRTVKINEAFNEVQTLTKQVSNIEKENSQISVNIQNSLNLSNIEKIAASTLGMQKLSSKQTTYITLDTKDYVEVNSNNTKQEENKSFFEKILDKISQWF